MKTLTFFCILLAALTEASSASASLVVSGAWSRPAISTGVVYLTITNHSMHPDRLISAKSPVAGAVELHESTETHGSMGSMDGMAMNGVASMHRVPFIPIRAEGTTTIAPGGYHIMLIDLHHDVHANQIFPLELHFAHAGWIVTEVHVRPI